MVLTIVGLDQSADNNKVKIDNSEAINVSLAWDDSSVTAVDDEMTALRLGNAFSASTGIQTLNYNEVLNQVFSNPIGSGRRVILTARTLSCNREAGENPMEAGFVANPAPLTNPTSVTPSNRKTGEPTSGMDFEWSIDDERVNTDPPANGEPTGVFVPTNGQTYKIEAERIIEPGNSSALFIRGTGQVGQRDRVAITYTWYEEVIE